MAEEGAFAAIEMVVVFDDHPNDVTVKVLQRDMLTLEKFDRAAIDADGNVRPHHMVTLAWLALSRMKRTKKLDESVPLPETLDEFWDVVDVTVKDDPAQNPTDAGPSTG